MNAERVCGGGGGGVWVLWGDVGEGRGRYGGSRKGMKGCGNVRNGEMDET